jgi:hypothetical protein
MSRVTESYLKVPYDIRPAKQVERRMLIDAFHHLSQGGFPINSYQYTGFGSIYYVDFILFHKLLGINRMLCVEHSTRIKKRVAFNKPFECVDLLIAPIGDVITTLSGDRKHLLWLDYDDNLQKAHLEDVILATTYLSSGSILLVTVDVEPPGDNTFGPEQWRDYYQAEAGDHIGPLTELSDFAQSNLPRANVGIIDRAIQSGLASRELIFIPLFHFIYADGHQMLTAGGMIGSEDDRRAIKASKLADPRYSKYARFDLQAEPYRIRIPRLTRRERLLLDSAMPCADEWQPKDFELSAEDVKAYREVYRFCPAYAELLL